MKKLSQQKTLAFTLLTLAMTGACASTPTPTPTEPAPAATPTTKTPTPAKIVAAADRTDADRALDDGRKPAEFLAFLAITPA